MRSAAKSRRSTALGESRESRILTPEEIDDGQTTAPSKRIRSLANHYQKVTDGNLAASRIGLERQRFSDRLRASLDAEPLEDGMDHPAESVIAAALDSEDPDTVLRWIRSFCLDSSNPAFAAAVFVCVARQPGVGTAKWREELVRGGLAVDDVEVRDAAMQAAEYWADPDFLHVLSAHSEPVGWLDEYRRGVMDDLGG